MTGKEAIKLLKGYNISDVYDTKIPYSDKDGFFTMRECVETVDKELTKYKRAFEILRELIKVEKSEGIEKEIIGYEFGVMARPIDKKITKEEYELLEELMKNED